MIWGVGGDDRGVPHSYPRYGGSMVHRIPVDSKDLSDSWDSLGPPRIPMVPADQPIMTSKAGVQDGQTCMLEIHKSCFLEFGQNPTFQKKDMISTSGPAAEIPDGVDGCAVRS